MYDLRRLKCIKTSIDIIDKNRAMNSTRRSEIKPTPELSSDIHYQNYGHHGLFPVITSRLAQPMALIGQFFVAPCHWPIRDRA